MNILKKIGVFLLSAALCAQPAVKEVPVGEGAEQSKKSSINWGTVAIVSGTVILVGAALATIALRKGDHD